MAQRLQNVEHVVFVDDDADVLASFVRDLQPWLRAHDISYDAVDSGAACLSVLADRYPATGLVISDLRMPDMNGVELFERIGTEYPDIGCILVTAFSDMQQINRAVATSILGLVHKPWQPDHLNEEVARAAETVDRTRADARRNRHLNEQLELAAVFQREFMAIAPPPDDRLEVESFSRPAPGMHLTGDYFDVVRLDADRYQIVVADAAGSGVRPALVSAMLKIIGRSQPEGPAQLLSTFNHRLASILPQVSDLLVSCIVADVDLGRGTAVVANAGHYPVIRVGTEIGREGLPPGPALGFDPNVTYTENEFTVKPGDRLVFYTDGIFEASPRYRATRDRSDDYLTDLFRRAHGSRTFSDEVVRLFTAERLLAEQSVAPLFADDATLVSVLVRSLGGA